MKYRFSTPFPIGLWKIMLVFLCVLRQPAWAVASYSNSQPATGIHQKVISKPGPQADGKHGMSCAFAKKRDHATIKLFQQSGWKISDPSKYYGSIRLARSSNKDNFQKRLEDMISIKIGYIRRQMLQYAVAGGGIEWMQGHFIWVDWVRKPINQYSIRRGKCASVPYFRT